MNMAKNYRIYGESKKDSEKRFRRRPRQTIVASLAKDTREKLMKKSIKTFQCQL